MFEAIIAFVKSCDKRKDIHSLNRHFIKHTNEYNGLVVVDILKGCSSCWIATATKKYFIKSTIRAAQRAVSVSLGPG